MRKILLTSRFERRLSLFVKLHPDQRDKVRIKMKVIAINPFKTSLRTHKLSGTLTGCLSSNITYQYRIVFLLSNKEIKFLDIGSHGEVY